MTNERDKDRRKPVSVVDSRPSPPPEQLRRREERHMDKELPTACVDHPRIEWHKADEDDVIMTIDEFIKAATDGSLIDYDGFGECAIGNDVSNIRIYPSSLDRYSWTTHVVWYNK